MKFKTKYRVVLDQYCGYEAQYKRWWWFFWRQIAGCNTRSSLEAAKQLCFDHEREVLWQWEKETK